MANLLAELYPTRNDSDAFLAEVNKYAIRRVSRKVRNHADAEDIGQLTAMYVWKHITKFDPERSTIANWVRMTADSMLNAHLTDRYKHQGDVEFEAVEFEASYTCHDEDNNYKRLLDCFGDDKNLLDLLLAGYSQADCEDELGLTRKAIRYRIDGAKNRAAMQCSSC